MQWDVPSSNAKLVYGRLCQYAGKDGVAYPKLETMRKDVGLCMSSTRRALKELKDLELIKVEQLGLGRANRYYFLEHPVFNMDIQVCPNVDSQEVSDVDSPYIRKESVEKSQSIQTVQRDKVLESEFEKFYDAYPRKVGRATALKRWLSKVKTLEQAEEVHKALHKQYDELSSRETRFIPHASTWLNQERWEDEVEETTDKPDWQKKWSAGG
jgi:DNA-binding transcriptional regulator GbsR (MarR family)